MSRCKAVNAGCVDCPYGRNHEFCFPCMKKGLCVQIMHLGALASAVAKESDLEKSVHMRTQMTFIII